MKKTHIWLRLLITLTAVVSFAGSLQAQQPSPGGVKIVRLDPRFDKLVPRDAKIEKIADGFKWVEGPVWNRKEGYLLFSDVPSNSVFKWEEGKGVSLFLKPSGYTGSAPFEGKEPGSNGLAYDSQGRLILAQHGDRRIARLEKNGKFTTLVDRYEGKRINSPNDLVFKSNGDLYFTDPPFGLAKTFDDPAKELPYQGVYRLSSNGQLTLLIKDIKAPNGIGFSPDEKTLYLTDLNPGRAAWLAYDVNPDGTVQNGRVFADGTKWTRAPNGPDGLKVDKQGNVYGARVGGVNVFAPDGTHIGSFETGALTANMAWGNDGSVLYIMADKTVYRIKLTTKGY